MVDEEISFKSWAKTEECLFRVYADFECLLQSYEEGTDKTIKCTRETGGSASVRVSYHVGGMLFEDNSRKGTIQVVAAKAKPRRVLHREKNHEVA